MGKSKEEDKIEMIIRGLLKLPENRRCINCSSLGPQYVCTTFSTYVCTNCCGVHREFTHRVKSVSMAKFSVEEVSALQVGGNEKARQIYFKTWDPKRNFLPDNRNIHKIREFIKHVYVDRKFTGETHSTLVQRSQNSVMYEPYKHKRADSSENSNFQEKTIDRYSRYSSDEVRSPQYLKENSRCSRHRAISPCSDETDVSYQVDDQRENSRYSGSRDGSSRFECTDGHYHVDNTRISGRTATQMFTTEDIKPRRRSPDRQQSSDVKNPTVRHVKEILEENSNALRVANRPRFSDRRCGKATGNAKQERHYYKEIHRSGDHDLTVSANSQITAESGSQTPVNNAERKSKSGSIGSLVLTDFSPQSDLSVPSLGPQTHIPVKQPVKKNACHAHSKNNLESLLFELFDHAEMAPSNQSEISCEDNAISSPLSSNLLTWHYVPAPSTRAAQALTDEHASSSAAAATTSIILSTDMPERSTYADSSKVPTFQMVPDLLCDDGVFATEKVGKKQSPSTHVSDTCSASIHSSHSIEGTNNQPTTTSPASSQPGLGPTRDTQPLLGMELSFADSKANERKELPADLFASPYQFSSMPASGWPTGSSYGMGYNMHYYTPQMQRPPFQNVAKPSNPFDTNDNTAEPRTNMFATTGFLQGGLSHMFIPSGISQTSFGSHPPDSASTGSPSHLSSVQHQSPFAPASSSHCAHMGQQSFHNMSPTSIQGTRSFGSEVGSTVLLHSNQQIRYKHQAPTDQRSFPMGGGNPFG